MPTYDYECDACGHAFELYQGINDPVQKKCPECKKQKLRRLLGTGAAVVFKGSGFYQTDYRSESYRKAKAADKSSAGGDSASSKSDGTKGEGAKTDASKTDTSKAATSKSSKKSSKGD
ncbi:MAG: zinc ribbon domain-containing protein [Planctomycetales bacterium]|nr:zinc ribbon domain-containing protein [Planctomycetales bacterium]